jgi:hypothetical protein
VSQPKTGPEDAAQITRARASAKKTLQQARQKFLSNQPIRANIVETVVLGSRKFQVLGKYLHGQGLKLRLEYQLQVGKTKGSLLEVCDGQMLYSRQRIGKTDRITRRDVIAILGAAAKNRNVPKAELLSELGLGGLPALLASLERSFDFIPQPGKTVDGTPFSILEGGWNAEYLDRLKRQSPIAGELPSYVPDRVRIYFDSNLFPRRILYLKQIPGRTTYRPMVTVDFKDVVLKAQVNSDDFNYIPPDSVTPEDVTQYYLQQLLGNQNKDETKKGDSKPLNSKSKLFNSKSK